MFVSRFSLGHYYGRRHDSDLLTGTIENNFFSPLLQAAFFILPLVLIVAAIFTVLIVCLLRRTCRYVKTNRVSPLPVTDVLFTLYACVSVHVRASS